MPCEKALLISESHGSGEKSHARLPTPEPGEELLKHARCCDRHRRR